MGAEGAYGVGVERGDEDDGGQVGRRTGEPTVKANRQVKAGVATDPGELAGLPYYFLSACPPVRLTRRLHLRE
jgi:hypothetical protein